MGVAGSSYDPTRDMRQHGIPHTTAVLGVFFIPLTAPQPRHNHTRKELMMPLTIPEATEIIDRLTTRIHELIGTDYRDAAIDAASRAEAAETRAETHAGDAQNAAGSAAQAAAQDVRAQLDSISTTTRGYRDQAQAAYSQVQAVVEDGADAVRGEFAGYLSQTLGARDAARGFAEDAAGAAAAEVEKLKGGAPEAFDTLGEIARELASNETERAALANSIGEKAKRADVETALAGKADTDHRHPADQIDNLDALIDERAGVLVREAPKMHVWDGEGVWVAPAGAGPNDSVLNLDSGEIHSVEDING